MKKKKNCVHLLSEPVDDTFKNWKGPVCLCDARKKVFVDPDVDCVKCYWRDRMTSFGTSVDMRSNKMARPRHSPYARMSKGAGYRIRAKRKAEGRFYKNPKWAKRSDDMEIMP